MSILALTLGAQSAMAAEITTPVVGDVDIATNGTHYISGSGSVTSSAHTDQDLVLITPDPFTGSFNNAGTIRIDGFTGSSATALTFGGDLDGSIVNSGTIETNYIPAFSGSSAYGLAVNGDVNGTIRNTGRIEIGGTGINSFFYSAGIIAGQVNGTVSNEGTIMVAPNGAGGTSNSGLGFRFSSVSASGTVRNSGLISVRASDTSRAGADGLNFSFNEGAIENTGTINVSAIANTSASAAGINGVALGVGGSVRNSGTITAIANGSSWASALGITNGFSDGDVINTGTITVEAASGSSAIARGVSEYWPFGSGSAFLNTGTITVTATSSGSSADAGGVRLISVRSGETVSNGGTILVEARGVSDVDGIGVRIANMNGDGSFVNSGAIEVTLAGQGSGTVEGIGVELRGGTSGLIENSGTISLVSTQVGTDSHNSVEGLTANELDAAGIIRNSGVITVVADGGSGEAVGLYTSNSDAGSLIENTGTINVTARGAAQEATGADISTARGTAIHSGSITATAADGADRSTGLRWVGNSAGAELIVTGDIIARGGDVENTSLDLAGAAGIVDISSTATLVGEIVSVGKDITLRSVGASATYEFGSLSGGSLVTEVAEGGSSWFVQGEGTSTPIYATVVSEEIAGNPNVMADAVNLLDVQAASLGAGSAVAPEVSRRDTNLFGIDEPEGRYFQFQISALNGGDHNTASDVSSTLLGLSSGFVGVTDSGADFAFGGGLFAASGSSGETDFDTFGAFLGRSTVSDWGGMRLSNGFGGGLMMTDQSRMSAGSTPASSDFVTAFLTGHVGLEANTGLHGTPVKPFGSLRYTHFFSTGYTETGGAANATVAAHNYGVVDLKLGGKVSDLSLGDGQLTTSVALAYRTILGGDQDVSIFGQAGTASISDDDRIGGDIAVQYSQPFRAGSLDLGANLGSFGGGNTSLTASARYSIDF